MISAIKKYFTQCLQNESFFHLGAFEGEQCIGFLQGEFQHKAESPFKHAYSSVHVHQIVVKDTHRGRGVAKLLVQEAEHRAKEAGLNRIDLTVWRDNVAALAFNKSYGFEEDLIRMWKKVE